MRIIDTHCHPETKLYEDRDRMIENNLAEEVFMIAIGNDLDTSKETIELAQQYKDKIWATVGCHPDEIKNLNIDEYKKLISDNVVAIGEVGLDYFRTSDSDEIEYQKNIFKEFINLSIDIKLPLVLHIRDKKNQVVAYEDTLDILNIYKDKNIRGVVHSFTASIEIAKKFMGLGFHIGLNGIITFSNQYDELIKFLPIEKILLETDAPWLSPEPYRGQINEPKRVVEVAKKISELKNYSLESVIQSCNQNAKKFFNIDF